MRLIALYARIEHVYNCFDHLDAYHFVLNKNGVLKKMFRKVLVFPITMLLLLMLSSIFLSACRATFPVSVTENILPMASINGMPAEVKAATLSVQEAYRFATATPQVLQQIPCYCGCGSMGHTSNYACYVQGVDEQGVITFDTHALGCSICVDITLDTIRHLKDGKTTAEIKTVIDQTYAQYGPSNIP